MNTKEFRKALKNFLGASGEIKNRKVNESVNTVFQVKALLFLNKLNQTFPVFYSKLFKMLRLTPRYICQFYLKWIPSRKYEMDPKFKAKVDKYFRKDWEEAYQHISYEV